MLTEEEKDQSYQDAIDDSVDRQTGGTIVVVKYPEVAKFIRETRYQLGLTLAEFSLRIGVTSRAVQYWEAGMRKPGRPVLKLINRMRVRSA